MAEILGALYGRTVILAIIRIKPYYLAVFILIDLDVAKRGFKSLSPDEIAPLGGTLRQNGRLLVPPVVMVYFLAIFDLSPYRAAFFALIGNLGPAVSGLIAYQPPKSNRCNGGNGGVDS